MARVIFVSAIDTGAGKTVATAALARGFRHHNLQIATQKSVQTGYKPRSGDILQHLAALDVAPEIISDAAWQQILPYSFEKAASPHLAAQLAGRVVDENFLTEQVLNLSKRCDVVIVEGSGGLLVPLNSRCLTLDWVAQNGWEIALVSHAKLGSINHTLLSLEAIFSRGLKLSALIFNHFFDHDDALIANDTAFFLHDYLQRTSPATQWLDLTSEADALMLPC